MFNVTIVREQLDGLVGYRQPANPKYAFVDAENLKSKSGLYVTDNPYAKLEYLKATVDYERASNTQLNDIMRNILGVSAVGICGQVFNDIDFIDRDLLYIAPENKTTELQLPTGFVGYRIEVGDNKNIAVRLNRAIFEFVEDTTIDLLIFNSNVKEPLHTISVDVTGFYSVESLDISLDNIGYYKGSYFIGFINDGSIKSYNKQYPINTIKELSIDPVTVDTTDATLFDLDAVKVSSAYSGFNLDITVVDDYTDFIVTNKLLFARAIQLDAIIAFLNIYVSSLRSNNDERTSYELYIRIIQEIEGTRPDDNVITIKGLRPQMVYEISQIKEQIDKLKGGFVGKGYFVDTQE